MDNQLDNLLGLNDTAGRQEHAPNMLSRIHRVPKQIVDTCVSIGGNLKLIESGMPAPVLLPSQIAHDRILSINDGLTDSFVIAVMFYSLVFFGLNYYTVLPLVVFIAYWWFHIAWWQESFAWRGIQSVDEYISKTYTFYIVSLLFFLIVFSTAFAYGIQKYDVLTKIEKISIEKHVSSFKSNIEKNKLKESEKGDLFASLKTDSKKETFKESSNDIEAAMKKDFNSNYFKVFSFYSLYVLIFLVFTFFLAKYYKVKYMTFNSKMHEESEKELNSDLKNRQNALRDALE